MVWTTAGSARSATGSARSLFTVTAPTVTPPATRRVTPAATMRSPMPEAGAVTTAGGPGGARTTPRARAVLVGAPGHPRRGGGAPAQPLDELLGTVGGVARLGVLDGPVV